MIGQEKAARGEADLLRFHQRLGDQQVGGGMRLPGCGMVLADPGLDKAQLVGPAQSLKIPAVTVEEWALRWVRRHCEQTVLHAFCLPLGLLVYRIINHPAEAAGWDMWKEVCR